MNIETTPLIISSIQNHHSNVTHIINCTINRMINLNPILCRTYQCINFFIQIITQKRKETYFTKLKKNIFLA